MNLIILTFLTSAIWLVVGYCIGRSIMIDKLHKNKRNEINKKFEDLEARLNLLKQKIK
jgi:uncharacterized membrane-anchored protein YhcB (DUF1043 family)